MIRVLVVDDYQEHIDTLVSTLGMYGSDARGAATIADGFKLAKSWAPHLIICDGLMTEMKAWQFAYDLLKQDLQARPYMVALTGFASKQQRRLCEECGYDEYVPKPIELSTLLGWVQKARHRAEHVPDPP
jgi:CheY-like chemotaxis protein